jgi:hypothetical protein
MFSIYQKAENICVWLGTQKKNTGLGVQLAQHLASSITVISDMDKGHNWLSLLFGNELLQDAAIKGFHQLFESPWFLRCWVVQEVLAKSNPIAFCGDFQFDWSILPFAVLAMYTNMSILIPLFAKAEGSSESSRGKSGCLSMAFEFGQLADNLRLNDSIAETTVGRAIHVNFDTIDFFLAASEPLVTDPRDKVFAFLGLSKDLDNLIKPDYGLTIQETYYNLNKCLISQEFGSRLIAIAGSARRTMDGLPSWCLDLNFSDKDGGSGGSLLQSAKVHRIRLQAGSGSKGRYVIGPEPSELTVLGLRVDKIKELGPARIKDPEMPVMSAIMHWIKNTRQFLVNLHGAVRSRYPSSEEIFKCFCRLVVADDERFSGTAVQSHLAFVRHWLDLNNQMLAEEDPSTRARKLRDLEWPQSMTDYQLVFGNITMGRRVCVTEQGYLGLVHNPVHIGDEICVVLECNIPVVMRETSTDEKRLMLVGDAFVLDLMDGQAVTMENLSVQEMILQ